MTLKSRSAIIVRVDKSPAMAPAKATTPAPDPAAAKTKVKVPAPARAKVPASVLRVDISLSQKIYSETKHQAQQEARDKQTKQKQQTSRVNAPSSRPESPGKTPQKIIRLEYPGGAVNVGIASNDETKLLQALKNAGLKSV